MGDTSVFGVDVALQVKAFFKVANPTTEKYRELIRSCCDAARKCPQVQQTLTSVTEFAKAHGDKVGVAGALVFSSVLLYKSVALAGELEAFSESIEELKGKYKEKNAQTVELVQLHQEISYLVAQERFDSKQANKFFKEDFKKSREFFRDVEALLDAVEDLIQDVLQKKSAADINARFSAVVGILAGFALASTTAPVSMPVWLYRSGLALTCGISGGSTVLSLKNSSDAEKAYQKLKVLKGHLRQLRSELDLLMEKLMTHIIDS